MSPHRTQRPWQGQIEAPATEQRPAHDPVCYLCPGNARAGGAVNPRYATTFVFDNDFRALLPATRALAERRRRAAARRAERGVCRVVCFTPRHDLTLARMDRRAIAGVVDTWAAETRAGRAAGAGCSCSRTRAPAMGCSNPHPHGQIWATDAMPTEAARRRSPAARLPRRLHGAAAVDYDRARARRRRSHRVRERGFTAVVPFWASWPFETLLLPRRPVARLPTLGAGARASWPSCWGRCCALRPTCSTCSFPYSMGWHGAPFDADAHDHWQLHAHSIRRCCARRRCGSTWSATRCWPSRSAT